MKVFTACVATLLIAVATVSLAAHQEVFKGKVVAVEGTNVRVNVVDAKTKKEEVTVFRTDAETKVLRGDTVVTFANAKFQRDENISITVDHDFDISYALVIRLDAPR